MQRDALVLSGSGAAAAGQRRGARAPPPAPAPGRARALHDVPGAALRTAARHAGCRLSICRLRRGCRRCCQDYQQELQHRGSQTESQKARGRPGSVTATPAPGSRLQRGAQPACPPSPAASVPCAGPRDPSLLLPPPMAPCTLLRPGLGGQRPGSQEGHQLRGS